MAKNSFPSFFRCGKGYAKAHNHDKAYTQFSLCFLSFRPVMSSFSDESVDLAPVAGDDYVPTLGGGWGLDGPGPDGPWCVKRRGAV